MKLTAEEQNALECWKQLTLFHNPIVVYNALVKSHQDVSFTHAIADMLTTLSEINRAFVLNHGAPE